MALMQRAPFDHIEPVPLAASDSTATIHGGTNTLAPFTSTHTTFNQLIDNSVPAIDNDGHPLLVYADWFATNIYFKSSGAH